MVSAILFLFLENLRPRTFIELLACGCERIEFGRDQIAASGFAACTSCVGLLRDEGSAGFAPVLRKFTTTSSRDCVMCAAAAAQGTRGV